MQCAWPAKLYPSILAVLGLFKLIPNLDLKHETCFWKILGRLEKSAESKIWKHDKIKVDLRTQIRYLAK